MFTGRDSELKQIHAALTSQSVDQATSGGISKLEIAGMGGVGKSQIVIEYCYRYFPSYYGLVIWLGAQSAESIAAGYRQLMADTTGMDVNDKDTDEVVAEVKARLFRSKIPWLLVFDNLEDKDHSLLEKFVPNGGKGHVLVTTRLLNTDNVDFGDQTMILGCFNPTESVELLCRAAGKQNISSEDQLSAANELAECVGHLPLAVGIAAAYMKRCDVDCVEYLVRYKNSGIQLGHEAVSSSLSLSLEAIKAESPVAWEALRLLCWLGPDQITKKLLRALFLAKIAEDNSRADAAQKAAKADTLYHLAVVSAGLASCSALIVVGRQNLSRSSGQWRRGGIGAVVILSCIVFVGLLAQSKMVPSDESLPSPDSLSLGISGDVFEQTDLTWDVLKSFSILVVKQGVGSMHRLLAQALRRTQNEPEARHNLAICLHTMSNAWTFQPEKIETWQGSTTILEHVKAVVNHSVDLQQWTLDTATMSKEAGVFSAMALNRFKEAQAALEESLLILNRMESSNSSIHLEVRAETLYELGRVFRYEGNFSRSEESLRDSLRIFNRLARNDANIRHKVAATLHELGVLEVKKHNLDLAATFLQQALDLRRTLELESPSMDIEADCASTLHQLAAVHVAQKPPALENAEVLLKEALGLNMQLYQRAGTLKLKARVAIRRGDFNLAERSLAQALELYFELYGENASHINIAAVKFQQGTLAFQREQYEQAWDRFFECLRARRQVYAYSQGNHLEVSSVLHKLGCVAFVQKRIAKACEMLMAEKDILVQLSESSERPERLVQARLTNLTWLRKCAKEVGDDDKVRSIIAERAKIELDEKLRLSTETIVPSSFLINPSLQRELLECRVAARQYALSNPQKKEETRQRVHKTLTSIWSEIEKSPDCSMKAAAIQFHRMITDSLSQPSNKRQIFEACDSLRDTLREHGIQVVDAVEGKK
jgi:tetratricopeptide (TPR) repeat protein